MSLIADIKLYARSLKLNWLAPVAVFLVLLAAAALLADGSGEISKPFGYRLF